MFKFYTGKARVYECEHPVLEGETLHVHPPLVEVVRLLDEAAAVHDYAAVTAEILSRNTEGAAFTTEDIALSLDYDQLRSFLADFRGWLTRTKNSDPN